MYVPFGIGHVFSTLSHETPVKSHQEAQDANHSFSNTCPPVLPHRPAFVQQSSQQSQGHLHPAIHTGMLAESTGSENPKCPLENPCGLPVYGGPVPRTTHAIVQESQAGAFANGVILEHVFE